MQPSQTRYKQAAWQGSECGRTGVVLPGADGRLQRKRRLVARHEPLHHRVQLRSHAVHIPAPLRHLLQCGSQNCYMLLGYLLAMAGWVLHA